MPKENNKYKILVAYHKPDMIFESDILQPIHVGRALLKQKDDEESKKKLQTLSELMIGDDTGENISNKNSYYNEMTAIYWAWKNKESLGDPKYIGFMHYRRHFCLKADTDKAYLECNSVKSGQDHIKNTLGLTEKELEKIFKDNDVLVTTPYYKESVYEHFKSSHDIKQLECVEKIIKHKFSKYYPSFEKYIHGHNAYFCNMFIFPKEIFDEYCEFMFSVLKEYEESPTYDKGRFYVSERLTGAFIQYLIDSGKKVAYAPTMYVEEETKITVALATDKNFIPPTLVTIESMLANSKPSSFYEIVIMTSTDAVEDLKARTAYLSERYKNYQIKIFDMKEAFANIQMTITHISQQTYYRLMLSELLPNTDKVLYLDTDIVVESDLAALFRNDIANHYIGGVKAAGYYHPKEWIKTHSKEIGIPSNDTYVNAGVLLMNLKKIRQDGIDKKMFELIEKNFSSQDQDIINVACYGKIKILPLKYNLMTKYIYEKDGKCFVNEEDKFVFGEADVKEALAGPTIIHYADKVKPWDDKTVPYAKNWYKYAETIDHLYARKHKKVSIIIPIFNMEKYLAQCLESVFNQSLKDIDVICINDGSTDKTLAILKQFKAEHDNLIIVNQKNHGVAYSRNVGLDLARSDYVCFVDPDDFYPENDILSTLYRTIKIHHVKVAGGSWMEYIEKADGSSFYKTDFSQTPNHHYTFKKDGLVKYRNYQFDFGYQRFMFSLDLINENKIRFPLYSRYQDPPFFAKTMIAADEFYALKKYTYCYRFGHQVGSILKGKKLIDFTLGVIDMLRISQRNGYHYMHTRNVEQLNRNTKSYIERIQNGQDLYLIELLLRANTAVDRNLLKKQGWKINDNYIIDPLKKFIELSTKNTKRVKEIEEKEAIPFFLIRPFRYLFRYGIKTTIVRIFKGRAAANVLKARRGKK